jgi:hypothetical protein
MKLLMTLFMAVLLVGCNGIDIQKACELCQGVPAPPVVVPPVVTPSCPPVEIPVCPVCPVCTVCPELPPVTPPVVNKDLFLPAYSSDGSQGVEYKIDAVQWTTTEKRIYGSVLNNVLRKVSARYNSEPCNDGTDCIAALNAEEFFTEVCTELRSQNYRCGKHESWTDEICFGSPREKRCQGAHIFNYGGNKVAWAPGCMKDSHTWVWE